MASATQVLRNTTESVRVTFTIDGIAADADGAVTVTVTRDDGTAIATAAATAKPASTTGLYTYTLAAQANLDHLTAVWTGTFAGVVQSVTTYVDIVGGFYVSLAELRALPNLGDAAKFPTADLITARQWFETTAENYCGQAFVPRYKRTRASGCGTSLLLDSNIITVRSVRDYTAGTVYTSLSADELADLDIDPVGWVNRISLGSWRQGNRNLEFVYEYGMRSCPDDVADAAKTAIAVHLMANHEGRREYALQTDMGIIRMSIPGPQRPTGLPEVDRVLNHYRFVSVG